MPVSIIALLTNPKTTFLSDRHGESVRTDFCWNYYASNTGLVKGGFNPGYQFNRADLMLQAVISGMGVGLGRTLLIEGSICSGFLQPVGRPIRMRSAYWLVCSASFAEKKRYVKLRDWLKNEVKTTLIRLIRQLDVY